MPLYPAYLPDGETDFQVDLQPFSRNAVKTFLKIERRRKAPPGMELIPRQRQTMSALGVSPNDDDMSYYSLGEFYDDIREGLEYLDDKLGDELFSGDPSRQLAPEYYYSGGSKLLAIKDLSTAKEALRVIIEQSEGFDGEIYTQEGELAHDYRFQELLLE